jgi:hypothetical protein
MMVKDDEIPDEMLDLNRISGTLERIKEYHALIQRALKEGSDYGFVPGKDRPTLLKPGAEKVIMTMGLTSEYTIIDQCSSLEKNYFSYTIKCMLFKGNQKITEGIGHCDTREYPAVNTCLKMAKKRAQIDASLTVGCLSEIFAQDLDDPSSVRNAAPVQDISADAAGIQTNSRGASDMLLDFGRYKGHTLRQIYAKSPNYVEWLSKNAKDEAVKAACQNLMSGIA